MVKKKFKLTAVLSLSLRTTLGWGLLGGLGSTSGVKREVYLELRTTPGFFHHFARGHLGPKTVYSMQNRLGKLTSISYFVAL